MPIRGTPTPRLRRWDEARVHPKGGPKDLCFRTCPRRGAVSLPVTGPRLARPVSRREGSRTASARRSRPLRRASLASRPTPRVGHIHSSRCRTTGSPEGERRPDQWPGDAPAGCAGGEFSMMRTGSKAWVGFARPSAPITVPRTMVEQDGIEPTTSCLQSTRSTD